MRAKRELSQIFFLFIVFMALMAMRPDASQSQDATPATTPESSPLPAVSAHF